MITLDDWGEIHCTYTTCSREFCEGEICHAGLYQCPRISERAKAWLPSAIESLEEFKRRNQSKKHDDYYYSDLAYLENEVKRLKELAE